MKVSLITGASGGIGAAFAEKLAAEQHNLLLVARSEEKLKKISGTLSAKYKITARYLAVDLSKPGADELIYDETARNGWQIEYLINNAGIGSGGDFLEYKLEEYQTMMQLNMNALVALTYRFLPQMRERRSGTIINVGSMAGFGPIPYMNVYAATKIFVRSFTQALWEENRPYNVQVMLLCPGATETGFFDAAKIGPDRKKNFSTKRLETPEQVVNAAMKGLKNKKVITISGMQNKIGRVLLLVLPVPMTALLRVYGNMMRRNLNLEVK